MSNGNLWASNDDSTPVHDEHNGGRDAGALDIIVHALTTEVFADRVWFDFGISTEDQGRKLNEGLARQKEMFGARTTVYETYELSIASMATPRCEQATVSSALRGAT